MTRLLFFIAILFISCNQKHAAAPQLLTHAVSLGGRITCDTTEYVFLKSSLVNNSEDTVHYVSMLCSWDEGYQLTTKELSIVKNICYSNVPTLINLAPHKSYDRYLQLAFTNKTPDWRKVEFKLGYNLVLLDTTKKLWDQVDQIGDMKNVTWSDTIRLKSFWNE